VPLTATDLFGILAFLVEPQHSMTAWASGIVRRDHGDFVRFFSRTPYRLDCSRTVVTERRPLSRSIADHRNPRSSERRSPVSAATITGTLTGVPRAAATMRRTCFKVPRHVKSVAFRNAIAYLRVSSYEQARSGLGIEAQRLAI
jgi:hypothetical protein